MLLIEEWSTENCRTLRHGANVFREALKWLMKGERRFHVSDGGSIAYDLQYIDNHADYIKDDVNARNSTHYIQPPYYTYDEDGELSFEVLNGYDEILFEEADEYTVVLTRLILEKTDKKILFADDRILWFYPESERLTIVQASESAPGRLLCTKKHNNLGGVLSGVDGVISAMPLFHNVFIWQWMCDRPLSEIKYATVSLLKLEGIGAVIDHFLRIQAIFAKKGIKAYLKEGSTRYDDAMLRRLFFFEALPEDADETNTLDLPNVLPLRLSDYFYKTTANVSLDMLDPEFLSQIDEYYNAVFQDEKVLGVLIRGTDYVNLKMGGTRAHATAEEMIPVIDQWIEEDGYERIFLATEDADVLEKMRDYYGRRLAAVSQKRYRVSDFKEGQFLSDVEKQQDPDEYAVNLEDTTVNYYYALVILARCASFMVSGQCNGWEVVRDLNGGKFLRMLKCGGEKK